jgi:methylmalonyl-CoA mutase
MERLYAGFDLADPHFSVSMTINGPAQVILAMYVAAAQRQAIARVERDGPLSLEEREQAARDAEAALRGTVQADILKEAQAQNEMLFPLEPALRFLGDMVEWVTERMPRWYPISTSGYHIAEAGATPAEQAAFTLANGFHYVASFRARGMDVGRFGPRLSFFLDCGLDVEYLVLARVCRRLWAIATRDVFHAPERAQLFRLHTQTSGRSLIAPAFRNNLTRTAIELLMAYANYTNSCHSNSADEPFTTPTEEYVRLASNAQAIVLEESGLFRHTMNLLGGSPGLRMLERKVEAAILEILAEIDSLGGVLAAVEARYFRSRIQESALNYERQVNRGERVIVGLNRYAPQDERPPRIPLARTPPERQREQAQRVRRFKAQHAGESGPALDRLARVAEAGDNIFDELVRAVSHCTLGQITGRLQQVVGRYRPPV